MSCKTALTALISPKLRLLLPGALKQTTSGMSPECVHSGRGLALSIILDFLTIRPRYKKNPIGSKTVPIVTSRAQSA